MYELTISNQKEKLKFMEFAYEKLKPHVENSKGLIVFESVGDRSNISLAVPNNQKSFYKAFTLELVSEIMVMDYKYDYLKNHLSSKIENQGLWIGFLKALTVFDKQTDKELVKKNLSFENEILIDSAYHFKMWELLARWKEITELVSENLASLAAKNSFMDLLRFLIVASDSEADTVYVKNCKNNVKVMINNEKIAKNLCFLENDTDVTERIIAELICLNPRQIVIDLPQDYDKLIDNVNKIFPSKVSVIHSYKSDENYEKSVDNTASRVYT